MPGEIWPFGWLFAVFSPTYFTCKKVVLAIAVDSIGTDHKYDRSTLRKYAMSTETTSKIVN